MYSKYNIVHTHPSTDNGTMGADFLCRASEFFLCHSECLSSEPSMTGWMLYNDYFLRKQEAVSHGNLPLADIFSRAQFFSLSVCVCVCVCVCVREEGVWKDGPVCVCVCVCVLSSRLSQGRGCDIVRGILKCDDPPVVCHTNSNNPVKSYSYQQITAFAQQVYWGTW